MSSASVPSPSLPHSFEKRERAEDIRLDKRRGSKDGTIHMQLGGEVNNGINFVFAKYFSDQLIITYIALDKCMPRFVGQIF